MFDVNAFLNQTVTGPLSTRIAPVPVGDYRAAIDKLEVRPFGEGPDAQQILRLTWKLTDPQELAAIDRQSATVRQDIWLDLTEDGELDAAEGKNTRLGRVFEAVGMNDGGATIGGLTGCTAIVRVTHRADKKDLTVVYDEVSAVTALG